MMTHSMNMTTGDRIPSFCAGTDYLLNQQQPAGYITFALLRSPPPPDVALIINIIQFIVSQVAAPNGLSHQCEDCSEHIEIILMIVAK